MAVLIVQICSIYKCDLSVVRGNSCLPLYILERNPFIVFLVVSSPGH